MGEALPRGGPPASSPVENRDIPVLGGEGAPGCPGARDETSAGHRQGEEAQRGHAGRAGPGIRTRALPRPRLSGGRVGLWESWRVAGEGGGACRGQRAQTEALGGTTRTTPSWK